MMKRILLTMLIGGVCGYIMVSAGFFFNDWKYWGILACMVAMAIVGGSCDEVEARLTNQIIESKNKMNRGRGRK